MRYRKLSDDGDFSFGLGKTNYYISVPDAVAQAALTKLRLFFQEWELDTTDGTRWKSDILGANKTDDQILIEIRRRLNQVPHVRSIDSLTLGHDKNSRSLTITAYLTTDFGQAVINTDLLNMNPLVTVN